MSAIELRWKNYGAVAFILLAFVLSLFRMEENFGVGILLLCGAIVMLPFPCYKDISCIDGVVLSLSLCGWNDLHSVLFCLSAYVALRCTGYLPETRKRVLCGVCCIMGIALLLSLSTFFFFVRNVKEVGFTDIYALRYLFRPLGYPTNLWSTLLLPAIGLMQIARVIHAFGRWRWLLCSIVAFLSLWLSFSRGVYLACGAGLVLWIICIRPIKMKWELLSLVITTWIVVCCLFPCETRITIQMNHTELQQQSTQGRITAQKAAIEIGKRHPLCGTGAKSYSRSVDTLLNQDSTRDYTSFAPNLIVQFWVEKGIVGLCLFFLLCGCVTCYGLRHRRSLVSVIMICFWWACVLKEMTLSTWTLLPSVSFLIFALLAVMQWPDSVGLKKSPFSSNRWKPVLLIILICGWSYNIVQTICHQRNVEKTKVAAEAVKHNKIEEAVCLLEETDRNYPCLINRGILYWNCYKLTGDNCYLQKAEDALDETFNIDQNEVYAKYLRSKVKLLKGDSEGLKILKDLTNSCPRNALFWYNYYRESAQKDNGPEVQDALERAVALAPRISLLEDSLSVSPILQRIRPVPAGTAADHARYGMIRFLAGDTIEAKKYLNLALKTSPALSLPWWIMGDIYRRQGKQHEADSCFKKYLLLQRGVFQKGVDKSVPSKLLPADEKELTEIYRLKFQGWYGYPLYEEP